MPTNKSKALQTLEDMIDELKDELSDLDTQRDILLHEIEDAEKALDAIKPPKRKNIIYSKDMSFKQKINYCLRKERKILSVNDMEEILFSVDEDLKEDKKGTNNHLRITIFRMLKSKEIIEHKTEDNKMIQYGLPTWES